MTVQPAVGSRRMDRPGFLLDLISGADTDLESVQRLADSAAVALAGSAGVPVDAAATLTRAGNLPATAGSATLAYNVASSEDRYSDGPMAQAAASAAPVQVTGDNSSQRWEPYRRRLVGAGYGTALAVPLALDPRSSCALVFLGPAGFEFTPELAGEATWFAAVASQSMKLALEVRSVRSAGDNLKAVLESRTSIDVACGVIMAQNRCSYTDAFGKLAGVSRQRNLKVRSVAENVLKALPNGSPATRFEPPALA
ncbi:hypothetical protein QE394_002939 [Arthrobacter sp. SORGH_AS 212]|uniref:ANTAR domain-containing protein n=1 Tax=Pseudarthrobacter sp. SORGH_AS 212 TaxID=3041777 RepID=UPI0027857B32|nr:hypothetical protein [Arthrobacter sp. SORGH_AS_0212]